jgi:hypothetical protein
LLPQLSRNHCLNDWVICNENISLLFCSLLQCINIILLILPRPVRSPTLFRQSVVLNQGSTSGSLHSSPTLPQQSSLVEIWRSESVIQVFIDFWLSYGEREMPYLHLGSGTPPRVRTWLIIFDIVKINNHRLLLFSLFFLDLYITLLVNH